MEFKIAMIGDEIYGDTTCLEDGFLSLHTSRVMNHDDDLIDEEPINH